MNHPSGGRGCLEGGHLGLPGQVWELRFFPSFPSFPREMVVPKMSGKAPGSPRHPPSRHPQPSESSLPWNFITHGFLDPSAFPDLHELSVLRAELKVTDLR